MRVAAGARPRPLARLALALAAALVIAGCAAPQAGPPRAARTAADGLPDPVRVAGVPFVAQPDWQCGPAALAIAMAAAGRPVPVETLSRDAFTPALQGSLQAEMIAATRRQGLLATELPASLDALSRELAAGRPVIVLQNLGLEWFPRWHYAVVTGVDRALGEVVLHSGDTPSLSMRLSTFERTWARSGRWAIAITPPDRLPASADETAVLRAVVALERVDPAAAAAAWEAVVARWPHSRIGLFGRANRRLADGEPRRAVPDLVAALALDPGFADAWNNLARALQASGRVDAARLAADRAVALGGPRLGAYLDTRAALGRP
ncbi:MAG: hypothetical protein RJA99_1550 [Pseudomonadota bacterium]